MANLSNVLKRTVEACPAHPALVFEGQAIAYRTLWDRATAAAARLRDAGVQPGDRVALLLPNVPAFPVALYGALRLAAIAVPINPTLTDEELAALLRDAGAEVVVTVRSLAERLGPLARAAVSEVVALTEDASELPPAPAVAPASVTADTPAVIVFSSGTTGEPKGVTLSHGNLVSNLRVNAAEVGMTASDRALLFMPLFHCYGLNVILNSALSVGATVVLERHFDPRRTAETIALQRVTMFFGVPTTFIVLLQQDAAEALTSLRYCYCAAAPLPREIEDRWRAHTGLIVNQAYGLSEASPCVAYNHVSEYRAGSIGVPSAGVRVRLVDPETGVDVAPGAVGELWVSSPGVMLGYWGRPEATAAVLRDGWLRTGDLGRRDEDGYLYLTDRLKDMINCGGMKVYPTEVENVLYRFPTVGEAAVVGVPDGTMGEVVHAQIAPRPGATIDTPALRAFLRDHLAPYKRPTSIRVVDALPKGRTGKILRREVRRQETRQPGAAAERRWTQRALLDWIVDWLRRELEVGDGAQIAPDGAFVDCGVDSLMAVRKAEALSELLGRPVSATVTWLHPTPERLAAHLAGEVSGPPRPRPAPDPAQVAPPSAVAAMSDADAEAALLAELEALAPRLR
ncbi:MAG: AMP-binding protein [Myxococcales bacterium]|nr:AMP-binding protein [Myxococcales bacterium]